MNSCLNRPLVFLALLMSPLVPSLVHAETRPPNIIFIMVDDLGTEWVSCYGAENIETPRIDQLAREGVRFTQAYSMPKCTPTRVSLLTGQYPFRHGWIGHWDVPRWGCGVNFDPDQNVTFAQMLRTAGYATAIAGKWQINDFRVQPDALAHAGFDEHCMWTGFETGNPESAERFWDPYIITNGEAKTHPGEFGPDLYTNFLIDFMKRHRSDPFMLYFPMVLTHVPFVHTPDHPELESGSKLEKHIAMVRYTDKLVGRIADAVDELGLAEDTVIIFTTDNGTTGQISNERNGERIRGGKDSFRESGAHAPFIVRYRGGVEANTRRDQLIDFTDMLPTFADLAGAAMPHGHRVDGESIVPFLDDPQARPVRDWVLLMGVGKMKLHDDGRVGATQESPADRTVRNERYKLWLKDGKPARLYDLIADPLETTNLIDSSETDFIKAKAELSAILYALPPDARPVYKPTAPQEWDKHRSWAK